jgi:hypothetical protein
MVKYAAEVQVGIHTTYAMRRGANGGALWHRSIVKLEKARISLIEVNLQLGGVNVALKTAPKLFINGIMIGGADVTHPQLMLLLLLGDGVSTSTLRPLSDAKRAKRSVLSIMMTCLSKRSIVGNSVYRESKFSHASLPDGIVIYRNGVSEAQFQDDFNCC